MKITLAFLLISLSCCFTLPVENKDQPAIPVPKQPQPVPKQPQPVPQQPQPVPQQPQPVPKQPQPVPKPVPNISCLIELLKKDAPELLKQLGTLLCEYRVAQKQQNVANFITFLQQVEKVLKQVGCTLSNLLGFKVAINAANAEMVANDVALVLFQFVQNMIESVMKVLDDIPILRDFVNDVPLTNDIRELACYVLDDVLTKIARILSIIADLTGGLTQIIDGL